MAPKREKPPLPDNIGTKYAMLDTAFDKGYPVRFIENVVMLPPLRMTGHGTTVKMQYDERYTTYYRRARLLGFILEFKRRLSTLIDSALTALINRWWREMHNFHLPCGEMTMTLEDWGMITTLPSEGRALTD
ncbi:Serine/threonine-protein phosphatase 7 long form-like protein [Hordeum vulgare]|nr:Serine/threonine-protein phosphatase 7 long form-like protein [Hordeum vulgare]